MEGSKIPPIGNITIRDIRPIAQEVTERVHPLPHLREAMGREFPPRRDYKTDSQYENRYVAQQRQINNTQQSWARSMYNAPPHMTSVPELDHPQGRIPPRDVGERATPVIRDCLPPIPGRLIPENTGRGRGRGGYIASPFTRSSEDRYRSDPLRDCPERESYSASFARPTEDRVRINSPQTQASTAEEESQDEDKYQEGPAGISAYRVSQGPPTSGLWNAEHYHYAVMLKRIRKLIIWKVGTPLTAPPGLNNSR